LPLTSPVDKQFWDRLLDFRLSSTDSTSRDIDDALKQLCSQLANNNLQTQNFSLLVEELIELLSKFPGDKKPQQDITSKTLHALFLVRMFSKYLIENCLPQQLSMHFQPRKQILPQDASKQLLQSVPIISAPPITIENMPSPIKEGKQEIIATSSNPNNIPTPISPIVQSSSEENLILVENLLKAMIDFSLNMEISNETYEIHVEILNTLLILLSTQLFSPPDDGHDLFMNVLLSGDFDYRSGEFVESLLNNYINQRKKPAEISSTFTLLGRLTSAASLIVFLPWNAYTYLFSTRLNPAIHGSSTPLADKSLLVLLVLVHRTNVENPFRKALSSLQDTECISLIYLFLSSPSRCKRYRKSKQR